MSEAIYSNANFSVVLAARLEDSNIPCYHLVNNTHGVVELETSVLIQAFEMADAWNKAITEFEKNKVIEMQLEKKRETQHEAIVTG